MSALSALPALGMTGAGSGLPVISTASEPEFVRNGSASVKSAYQQALGFEEMLVEELTKSMSETSGLGEGGQSSEGGGEEGSSSMLTSMMPQTLSESLTRGGGLGLASQLTKEIDPSALSSSSSGKVGA